MFCDLGFIYNKEDVLDKLLSKSLSSKLSHIRRLKDLHALHLQQNPDYDASAGAAASDTVGRWVCPVSGTNAGTGKPYEPPPLPAGLPRRRRHSGHWPTGYYQGLSDVSLNVCADTSCCADLWFCVSVDTCLASGR